MPAGLKPQAPPPLSAPNRQRDARADAHANAHLTRLPAAPIQIAPIADKKRKQLLAALRLPDARLAPLCVPSGYLDGRHACVRSAAIPDGQRAIFLLRATGRMRVYDKSNQEIDCAPYASWEAVPWAGYWSRFRRASIEMVDADGQKLYCTVFAPAQARALSTPGQHLVQGEISTFRARYLQKVQAVPAQAVGRLLPQYLSPGSATSDEGVRALVFEALASPDAAKACAQALIDQTLLSEDDLLDLVHAIEGTDHIRRLDDFVRRLHEPETPEEGLALRLAARRLSVIGLIHAARFYAYRPPCPKARIDLSYADIDRVQKALPVRLTRDQSSAIVAICEALRQDTPMNALLSGDVGTGKTLTFAVPAIAAHLKGARVAVIAPTDILADQLAAKMAQIHPQARVERIKAGGRIADPQAILVSTYGLSSVAQKHGYSPDLLIVDEQHKMAVSARRAMAAEHTHVLEASATPIPHAMAATLYAGTQMLTLRQAPVQRQIHSRIASAPQRSEISRQIRETMAAGHRVAIIYPRVSGQEQASVERTAQELESLFPGQVACLHGKLKEEQIQQTLQRFREGQQRLLVASTIVETGIDVPDIRLLIVRQADRFGIAQLHQLRGRLARNGGEGRFVMWIDEGAAAGDETLRRLHAVETITDGFALAEEDMRQRGFGDLLGEQQNGAISLPMRMLRLDAQDIENEIAAHEEALECAAPTP